MAEFDLSKVVDVRLELELELELVARVMRLVAESIELLAGDELRASKLVPSCARQLAKLWLSLHFGDACDVTLVLTLAASSLLFIFCSLI